MLKNLKSFLRPKSVKEAAKILSEYGPKAAVIAGGTIISRSNNARIEVGVDLSACGLSYIKDAEDGLHIGAMTVFQDLCQSPVVKKFANGLIAKSASLVSSRLIRNAGTVGGNMVFGHVYNSLPPVFLALDVKVKIAEKNDERWVNFSEFSEKHGTQIVGESGFLTEVLVPSKTRNWNTSFQRFARTASDWEAQVIVATALGFRDETCEHARIAVGAVLQHPTRFTEAENEVLGDSPNEKSFERAAKIVYEKVNPIPDWRSSKEYRKEILKTLVQRALAESCR